MRDEAGSPGGAAGQAAGSDPLCFVLMPFGRKSDAAGATIDFDAVYQQLIAPAIRAAGLEPVRADDDMTGGIVHKPMFERLILCEYAVADLTFANANVFYELGVRHAVVAGRVPVARRSIGAHPRTMASPSPPGGSRPSPAC